MRKRIVTSNFKPKTLHRMFLKSDCFNIVKKLVQKHGNIIPFRVLPINKLQHIEVAVILRRENYVPDYELKLFKKKF